MVTNVYITGAAEVNHFQLNLPKKMENEIMISIEEFARLIQKSARQRAPRDTTLLSKSIFVKRGKREVGVYVDSPYGIYQELGFRPHWVHSDMISKSGSTIGARLGKKGFIFVRRFKPFIIPAVEMAISRLPMFMGRAVEKAVVKSRK